MLSCDGVIASLGDFLDGEFTPERKAEIERHLAGCRTCSAIYDSTSKTIRIVTDSRTFEIPEAASTAIVGRIMRKIRDEDS